MVASFVLVPLRVTRFLTTAPARFIKSGGRDGGQEDTHDTSFIFRELERVFMYIYFFIRNNGCSGNATISGEYNMGELR